MNIARWLKIHLENVSSRLVLTLLTLSALNGAAAAQTQKPVFPVTTEIAIPGVPLSTPVIADFNGDGIPDLAYLSVPAGGVSLTVILSFGGSTSTTVTTSLCSATQEQVGFAIGDVNNDKKPDVVFTCNGYVTVRLGNGDGTFQGPAYYAANTTSTPVLIDLNGDGYLDIAVILSNGSPQVGVFLNEGSAGSGIYGTPNTYAAGSVNPSVLLAGDFNGDGKQDLSWPTSSGFTLLFGNGDGTFQAAQNQPLSTAPFSSVTTGDFNHDGITDIAGVANSSDGSFYSSVQILLGTTSGAFSQGTDIQFPATGPSPLIATADLTGDGNLDLVAENIVTTTFAGDGKGNFTQTGSYAISGYPLIADVNGDGKPDLLLEGENGIDAVFILPGNGDGTFQAVPATPISGTSAGIAVDVNGDGIADALFVSQPGGPAGPGYIAAALGRGDGTFGILNQSAALPSGANANKYFLELGDFNGDGKVDAVAVQAGTIQNCNPTGATLQDAQVFPYLGSGNGTFQAKGTGVDLGAVEASQGVAGDFNGDGKLDLILPYQILERCTSQAGLIFLSGNGDGTFAAPVEFSQTSAGSNSLVLVAGDLNNDGKLDLIWGNNNAVYLGNGDGTFKQQPLNLPGGPLALADVNGDGFLDLVLNTGVYAGNGDGTFQTTPLYITPPAQASGLASAAIGDVNGDGNPDLLELYTNSNLAFLSLALGDGHGNFTQDTNTYAVGVEANAAYPPPSVVLARLNNQSPALSDRTLDVMASFNSLYLGSLLNQMNPAPNKSSAFASATALQASSTSGVPAEAITLTATVLGINPTGNVSFSAGSTPLGTAALINGTASLQTPFANEGSYSVTASYEGDSNNSASTSNAVSIVIVAPGFTVAALPASGTVSPGQTASFVFTVTAVGGYAGTVKFACSSLPTEAACSFAPASLTLGAGSASSTLTITTTAAMARLEPNGPTPPWVPAGGLALAGIFGFVFTPRRTRRWNRYWRGISGLLLVAAVWLPFLGCGGGSGNTPPQNPGTPQGSYSVSVIVSDSAGSQQHAATVNLMVQ